MYRTLRAFAWMRFRILINSLEKTGSRDTLERFSIAIEKIGPLVAAAIMIPSTIALAVVGAAAGFALAKSEAGGPPIIFEAARYLLLAATGLCIVGPLMLPSADRTNPVRLLLLPISRATLYVAQSASAFGDPWIFLLLPLTLFLPLGLIAGAAFGAALVTLVAGAGLIVVLVGISALSSTLLHLLMRDRRRGELITLLFILILPMLGMLPGLLNISGHHRDRDGVRRERIAAPAWVASAAPHVFSSLPSELYVSATRSGSTGDAARAGTAIAGLALVAMCVHGLGLFVFGRVLDSPVSSGSRRARPASAVWGRTLPGLSPGSSAVALAQFRLALRTPRGRQILLSPIIMLALFAFVMKQAGAAQEFGRFGGTTGVMLGTFGAFMCMLSGMQLALNQFAIDRSGITLAFLSPLTDREYLDGKAVGNALITFSPALLCLAGAYLLRPGGSPAVWLSIIFALLSTYLLFSPIAALLSAIFPRAVDLNSIGRRGNAHGAAGLAGMFTFIAAAAPALAIALTLTQVLHRPALLTPTFLAWVAIAYGINRMLFIPVRRIFATRRENLSMLAEAKAN